MFASFWHSAQQVPRGIPGAVCSSPFPFSTQLLLPPYRVLDLFSGNAAIVKRPFINRGKCFSAFRIRCPFLMFGFEAVALLWLLKRELMTGKIMTQGPEIHLFLISQYGDLFLFLSFLLPSISYQASE